MKKRSYKVRKDYLTEYSNLYPISMHPSNTKPNVVVPSVQSHLNSNAARFCSEKRSHQGDQSPGYKATSNLRIEVYRAESRMQGNLKP